MPPGATRNKKRQAKGSQLTSKNGVTPNTPPITPQNNFQELQALPEGEFYIIHTNKIK